MANTAEKRAYIEAMARHLPPSGARLCLVDVGGQCAAVLCARRPDLDPAEAWPHEVDSADAVTALDVPLTVELLGRALAALRPGGRFIHIDSQGEPRAELVEKLANAGFTRILVEPALESGGALARGEKPHTARATLARIAQTAARDDPVSELSAYSGRYLHLLICQTPNKPVWALRPGERVTWTAAALDTNSGPALLAFSSLPKAVAFMQPAVLAGRIAGVNKVGKFSRAAAQTWPQPILFNPEPAALDGARVVFVPVDAASAEVPDE